VNIETLYFSINPNNQNLISGHLVQFWFVTFLGLFIWYALYKLLSNPLTRKNRFKYLKTIPRKWAFTIAGGIGLLIIAFAYNDNWSYFFQIDVRKNNLHLHYYLPKRTVTISTENIKELTPKEDWRKAINYRLIIKTKEGKEYSSSIMGSNLFKNNLNKLKQALMTNKSTQRTITQ
jgi:hypothetical protein